MLHPFDDLPLHQGPDPLLHLSSDSPGLYDRYFHNGHDANGRIFFGVALGVYPNRHVADAACSVVRNGRQTSVFRSQRAPLDRAAATVAQGIRQQVDDHLLQALGVGDGDHRLVSTGVVERQRLARAQAFDQEIGRAHV